MNVYTCKHHLLLSDKHILFARSLRSVPKDAGVLSEGSSFSERNKYERRRVICTEPKTEEWGWRGRGGITLKRDVAARGKPLTVSHAACLWREGLSGAHQLNGRVGSVDVRRHYWHEPNLPEVESNVEEISWFYFSFLFLDKPKNSDGSWNIHIHSWNLNFIQSKKTHGLLFSHHLKLNQTRHLLFYVSEDDQTYFVLQNATIIRERICQTLFILFQDLKSCRSFSMKLVDSGHFCKNKRTINNSNRHYSKRK